MGKIKHKIKWFIIKHIFTTLEIHIIEESLLRFCGYWNHLYTSDGEKFEDITDIRTLVGNVMHDEFYKLDNGYYLDGYQQSLDVLEKAKRVDK